MSIVIIHSFFVSYVEGTNFLTGKSKTKGLKIIFSRSFSDFIPSSVHEILNLQEIKNITYMYIKRLKNSWGNIYIKT